MDDIVRCATCDRVINTTVNTRCPYCTDVDEVIGE